MIKSQWEEVQTSSRGPVSDWTRHVVAHIALWAVSCASQIVLYTSAFWSPTAPKLHAITTSGPRDSIMSDLRSNRFLMKSNQPSSLADTMHSPTYSAGSSQSLKSFRDSMRHVVRPATSRTTLIGRTSLTRDASIHSQAESFDHVPHSDGFDSWDTSSVSLQARDAVMQSVSSRRTALDPIPGSRPTTPAYSLEGPFNSELEEDVEELAPPPRMMHDYSRPSSPANSEAHIHHAFPIGKSHSSTRSYARHQHSCQPFRNPSDYMSDKVYQPHKIEFPLESGSRAQDSWQTIKPARIVADPQPHQQGTHTSDPRLRSKLLAAQ
ncbi:hypothetical protein SNOG_01338 [Parastagonospora nodorum SN15]|uniref:Uncharacterized protein n=1 Tax=Phaeosphaeria nodorum (strain SN15 / ATCC MYA-4574 / FGSC 10173) TaxID=321614 RepID=Q0V3S6_PHANO|nr:hypothetical protein SNOG_01338 [Parastagonospora nodorum SN15]EAT90987.2 hypothetical protein SNOG_01338 [Parastagonospora nodorum SN15]